MRSPHSPITRPPGIVHLKGCVTRTSFLLSFILGLPLVPDADQSRFKYGFAFEKYSDSIITSSMFHPSPRPGPGIHDEFPLRSCYILEKNFKKDLKIFCEGDYFNPDLCHPAFMLWISSGLKKEFDYTLGATTQEELRFSIFGLILRHMHNGLELYESEG